MCGALQWEPGEEVEIRSWLFNYRTFALMFTKEPMMPYSEDQEWPRVLRGRYLKLEQTRFAIQYEGPLVSDRLPSAVYSS